MLDSKQSVRKLLLSIMNVTVSLKCMNKIIIKVLLLSINLQYHAEKEYNWEKP